MNTGDVTNESHELGNQNVASECEDQVLTSDCAEERSVERSATHLVFHESSRVNVSVALLCSTPPSFFKGTDASPQSNASIPAVLEPRTSVSILGSADQTVQHCLHSDVVK